MSNLARKLQQEQQQRIQTGKKTTSIPSRISPGEKILALVFGVMVCFGATTIVSNQAEIYKLNKDIQLAQASIQEQNRVNSDLSMQVSELSTYERIWSKARQLGLLLNENNVKVVQE